MQVAQFRRDVVVSRRTMNQSGGSIEDRLQTLVLVGSKPCECRVAVVEAWYNQRYDQRLEHGFGHRAPDGSELYENIEQR